MKTKLLLVAGAMLLAAVVSAFVYVNNEKNSMMSDLFNANVEALANGEGTGKYTCETDLKMTMFAVIAHII